MSYPVITQTGLLPNLGCGQDFEDYDHVTISHDYKTGVTICTNVPVMDDETIDDFFGTIEEAFVRQGGYMRQCDCCGKRYPYFPVGLGYGICMAEACRDWDILRGEEHRKKHLQEQEEIQALAEQAQLKKEKKADEQRAIANKRTDPKRGYVYLMKAANGLHKIGRAKDVGNRLGGLNRQIPILVTIVHVIASNDYMRAEKIMHERYKDFRVRYEWFNLAPEQVAQIMAISDHGIDVE